MELKPGDKQTEVGVIPEEWEVAKLAAVCSMKSGEGITSVSIDQFSEYRCYGGNGLRGFTARYTHDGRYALIGRQGALCGNVLGVEGKIFASEHAIVVTASARTDIRWLTFVLGKMRLNQHSESSAQPGLSVSKLLNLNVARPPTKAEQEAIANSLSDADALIESLEQLIAKKRHLKEGAMQELLIGKKRLPGLGDKWEVRRVLDFGVIVTGGTPSTKVESFWGDGYPWITPTDISAHRDMFTSERTITASGLKAIREIPANTLLVTCIASIGKNALLRTKGGCNQQINAVIPNKSTCVEFLYYLFEINRQYLLANSGITATSIISKSTFQGLTFRVPLLSEQTAIAAILSDMDAEIAALETKLAKARQIKQGMMHNLLTGRIRLV